MFFQKIERKKISIQFTICEVNTNTLPEWGLKQWTAFSKRYPKEPAAKLGLLGLFIFEESDSASENFDILSIK